MKTGIKAGSWGQLSEQGPPDFPLSTHFLQLCYKFKVEMLEIITKVIKTAPKYDTMTTPRPLFLFLYAFR